MQVSEPPKKSGAVHETQLVGRYLNPIADPAGLFLIAWFDPSHGYRAGTWKNDATRGNRDTLRANVQQRAKAAAGLTGRSIEAIVIDCSMPAEEAEGMDLTETPQATA